MKLNGKMMVAVVMMVGALGAAGCNAAASSGWRGRRIGATRWPRR